jgi:hypothetical protein
MTANPSPTTCMADPCIQSNRQQMRESCKRQPSSSLHHLSHLLDLPKILIFSPLVHQCYTNRSLLSAILCLGPAVPVQESWLPSLSHYFTSAWRYFPTTAVCWIQHAILDHRVSLSLSTVQAPKDWQGHCNVAQLGPPHPQRPSTCLSCRVPCPSHAPQRNLKGCFFVDAFMHPEWHGRKADLGFTSSPTPPSL